MANILLTSICNRSCPYCFAQREMADASSDNMMSWDNLIYIADFLQSSGERHVSLLGGEPTIHPQIVDFILYLIERNLDVTVFTNGVVSPARLREFEQYFGNGKVEKLTFVCNLNDPVLTPAPAEETDRLDAFLSAMGPFVSPGFNIYRTDFTLDFLFDTINRFGLRRYLRLGMTHPIPGKKNLFIHPDEMQQLFARLYSYREKFDAFRVKPGLDCGFPICRFSDEQLGWLRRISDPQFSCGAAIDITPDMSVYHCFPLSNYKRKSLFEFDSLAQIHDHFARLRGQIKAEIAGIYPECDGCKYQEENICGGGGMCQVLVRFLNEEPVRMMEIENELAKNRLPL